MLKKVYGKKLSRAYKGRQALFRSLIKALVSYGAITTTKVKAKAIQGDVDKIMNKVREGSLAKKREVLSRLGNDKKTTDKLFNEFKKVAESRKSGFTRIIALPPRRGDAAEIVRIEWTEAPKVEPKKLEKKETKKVVKAAKKTK